MRIKEVRFFLIGMFFGMYLLAIVYDLNNGNGFDFVGFGFGSLAFIVSILAINYMFAFVFKDNKSKQTKIKGEER